MIEQCGDCRHFKAGLAQIAQGQCMRFPPTAHPIPDGAGGVGTWSAWPIVRKEQSCGEFKKKLELVS